jgi:hypothetical protein
LYHGVAFLGILLLVCFLLQVFPYDTILIIGISMVAIPYLLVPPELFLDLKKRELIFRNSISYTSISFDDIAQITTSKDLIDIKNHSGNINILIKKKHFKNIHLAELSQYIKDLLSENKTVDPIKYTSIKLPACGFFGLCKFAYQKIFQNRAF